jgi:hypothetical protein
MYSLNQVNKLVSCGRDPARSLPLWRGFLLIPLVLVCFAFAPQTRAVVPAPDGCYGNFTTAEGCSALLSLTTGAGNTGIGWGALELNTTGAFNTALGAGALILNSTGGSNTAGGAAALLLNTTGNENTAFGVDAMVFNTTGDFNDAFGGFALQKNTDGFSNNAFGDHALFLNILGAENTAVGDLALQNNDSSGLGNANFNCAVGAQALQGNVDGDSNNAVGASALVANTDGLFNQAFGAFALSASVSGASNIAIGDSSLLNYTGAVGSGFNTVVGDLAGGDLTDGSDNIYIGATAGAGVTTESGTIRIGDPQFVNACFVAGITGVPVTGDGVVVDANGQLGVAPAGHPLSTKELLKERQVVQQLKATTEKQAARIALQEGQIQALTTALKQQAEQIQKVSAQLEMVRPAPRVVNNQ